MANEARTGDGGDGAGTVVIAGGSGVVGARALALLLARDDVGQVVAVGRRPLAVLHDKLVCRVADFGSAEAVREQIPDGIRVALCCLGTTRRQAGSKEAFRKVDLDAVVAFGRGALARGVRRFVLVSAVGANPRAGSFYARTKGQAEEALAELGFAQLTVLRPSLIDDQGTRAESRPAERVMLAVGRAIFAVAGKTRRYAPIAAETIARAAVRLAFDETTERVRVVESDALHAIGG